MAGKKPRRGDKDPKDNFLLIRLTPSDRDRVELAAQRAHLSASTWVRQLVLDKLIEALGDREGVAEAGAATRDQRRVAERPDKERKQEKEKKKDEK